MNGDSLAIQISKKILRVLSLKLSTSNMMHTELKLASDYWNYLKNTNNLNMLLSNYLINSTWRFAKYSKVPKVY